MSRTSTIASVTELLIFIGNLFLASCKLSQSYSSTCFTNKTTKQIPLSHVYYTVSKPAVIGYKGSMFSHQENTLEGIKAAADGKFQGVHMQVQATSDDKLIVFGDENLKVHSYILCSTIDASSIYFTL